MKCLMLTWRLDSVQFSDKIFCIIHLWLNLCVYTCFVYLQPFCVTLDFKIFIDSIHILFLLYLLLWFWDFNIKNLQDFIKIYRALIKDIFLVGDAGDAGGEGGVAEAVGDCAAGGAVGEGGVGDNAGEGAVGNASADGEVGGSAGLGVAGGVGGDGVVRPGSPATSSGHPPGPNVQPVTGRHTTALPSVCDAPPAGKSPSGSGPESLR